MCDKFYEPDEFEYETTEPEQDYLLLLTDLKLLAGYYIRRYFEGKKLDTGCLIPCHVGDLDRYVLLVLNTAINNGIKNTHEILGPTPRIEQKQVENNGHVSDNTMKIIGILRECSQKGIPKCFAGGILLMHVELCDGLYARTLYKVA